MLRTFFAFITFIISSKEHHQDVESAREIMKTYFRKLQIEEAYRYTKSLSSFESSLLHEWKSWLQLLMLAGLAIVNLLSLIKEEEDLRQLSERLLRGCVIGQ